MKKLIVFSLFLLPLLGFSQTNQKYEYLTMVQQNDDFIYLTKSLGEYEEIKIKSEMKGKWYDYSPLLKRIQKFEKEGWQLFNNDLAAGSGYLNYVMMRKPIE